MVDPCADLDLQAPVDVTAAIDDRDVNLVQKTWTRAAGLGAETVGKVLFMQIFSIAPEAIGLFPFRDHPQDRLYKVGSPLVEYGANIVNTLNVAIGMLNDLPALVPVLKAALPGLFPGAEKEHYGVVGQAALNSLAIALGRYWTEPVKNAWLKIWTTVVSVMFPEESKIVEEALSKAVSETVGVAALKEAIAALDGKKGNRFAAEEEVKHRLAAEEALETAMKKTKQAASLEKVIKAQKAKGVRVDYAKYEQELEKRKAGQKNPTAVFDTSMGQFVAEIYLDRVPLTASNFIDLAKSGFYDGIHFHRVIPEFMNQFGCPFAKNPRSDKAGTGGPKDGTFKNLKTGATEKRFNGGNIKDEFISKDTNAPGTLSMANTGAPNTGGSQFFINVEDNAPLDWFDDETDSKHPVFGTVTSGYDVCVAISNVETDDEVPVKPIKMNRVVIKGI